MITAKDLSVLFGVSLENIYRVAKLGLLPKCADDRHWIWQEDQRDLLVAAWHNRPDRRGRPRKAGIKITYTIKKEVK